MSQKEQSTSIQSFEKEHHALLALLAHAALQSVNTRSGTRVLDSLFTSAASLKDMYPEVRILHEVHQIRSSLRNLQECAPNIRSSFYSNIQTSLKRLYEILPDPLLLVIARAIEKMKERHHFCRTLEPYLLELIEHIQLVVLQETKSLQRRGEVITLRLRAIPPFVS